MLSINLHNTVQVIIEMKMLEQRGEKNKHHENYISLFYKKNNAIAGGIR